MRYMRRKNFNNLPNIYGPNLYLMKNGDLLKHVFCADMKVLRRLTKKQIDGAILPKKIYHVLGMSEIFYSQEHAKGYLDLTSFSNFEKEFSDREILEFFKELLLTEKRLHDAKIISGDITYSNIIMNEDLKHYFIDFDFAFVDELDGLMLEVGRCDTPFAENVNQKFMNGMYSQNGVFQYYDKASLINMILYALQTGNFCDNRTLPTFCSYEMLGLTKSQKSEIKTFLGGEKCIAWDEYLLDVFDDMSSKDYHLPYRKLKK